MARATKSTYYQALKAAGYEFDRHYRDYTAQELRELWAENFDGEDLEETPPVERKTPLPEAPPAMPSKDDDLAELRKQMSELAGVVSELARTVSAETRRAEQAGAPLAAATELLGGDPNVRPLPRSHFLDPNEHAGVTLNTHFDGAVIEVDEHGNRWFQKEVTKPASPRPRGRRVLRYEDPGVRQEEVKVGEYVEGFEVAGDPRNARPAEIKITLPSHQTGIYQPKGMPFRVHTYQGARGFNMSDVERFFGGADLVPETVKRCYVNTDLCYDMQSVIRTIDREYRERVLKVRSI